MKNALIALALSLLLFAPGQARAEVVWLETGTTLDLPDVEGMCRIDRNQGAFDRHVFETMTRLFEGTSDVLAIHADCDQLAAVRAGRSDDMTRYVIVGAVMQNGDILTVSPEYTRARFIDETVGVMDEGYLEDGMADGLKTLREKLPAVRDFKTGVQPLGLLDRDGKAAYTGMIMRASNADEERAIASVAGMTVVKGTVVGVSGFRPYEGAETVEALMALTREAVADLIAANGG